MTRFLPILLFTASAFAQTDSSSNDSTLLPSVDPVAKWSFESKFPGALTGSASVADDGPQPPLYPEFAKGNRALVLKMPGDAIRVKETDLPSANLRFTNGETITIEAWVNVSSLKHEAYTYLIGKGRNQDKSFTSENQNWALRLKSEGGQAKPTFLFRSRNPETKAEDYHRWTGSTGFLPGGWHHVAVTYTFGKPESILAFVDGAKVSEGTWDMAGPTKLPPVTDADDIMIGTGNGGGANNTLSGSLDEIAVYREALPEIVLANRYQAIPPPPVVDPDTLPAGEALVQICEEGIPGQNSWPANDPQPSETFTIPAFGLHEVPQKYVSTGVRGDRPVPYFLRIAAKVTLPKGKHRLLLRDRNANRLTIDGKQILITSFATNDLGGVLGAKRQRPELGETILAVSLEGTGGWKLVAPASRTFPYTDGGWESYEKTLDQWLSEENSRRRAEARTKHSDYWQKRRAEVKRFLGESPEIPVPPADPWRCPRLSDLPPCHRCR